MFPQKLKAKIIRSFNTAGVTTKKDNQATLTAIAERAQYEVSLLLEEALRIPDVSVSYDALLVDVRHVSSQRSTGKDIDVYNKLPLTISYKGMLPFEVWIGFKYTSIFAKERLSLVESSVSIYGCINIPKLKGEGVNNAKAFFQFCSDYDANEFSDVFSAMMLRSQVDFERFREHFNTFFFNAYGGTATAESPVGRHMSPHIIKLGAHQYYEYFEYMQSKSSKNISLGDQIADKIEELEHDDRQREQIADAISDYYNLYGDEAGQEHRLFSPTHISGIRKGWYKMSIARLRFLCDALGVPFDLRIDKPKETVEVKEDIPELPIDIEQLDSEYNLSTDTLFIPLDSIATVSQDLDDVAELIKRSPDEGLRKAVALYMKFRKEA